MSNYCVVVLSELKIRPFLILYSYLKKRAYTLRNRPVVKVHMGLSVIRK
jgi:hypothetical protein